MDDHSLSNGMASWPVPVRVYQRQEKLIRLNELSQSLKLKAWSEIKSNSPGLAELLKDAELKRIADFFSADIYIEAHHAPSMPLDRLKGRKAISGAQ